MMTASGSESFQILLFFSASKTVFPSKISSTEPQWRRQIKERSWWIENGRETRIPPAAPRESTPRLLRVLRGSREYTLRTLSKPKGCFSCTGFVFLGLTWVIFRFVYQASFSDGLRSGRHRDTDYQQKLNQVLLWGDLLKVCPKWLGEMGGQRSAFPASLGLLLVSLHSLLPLPRLSPPLLSLFLIWWDCSWCPAYISLLTVCCASAIYNHDQRCDLREIAYIIIESLQS